MDMSDPWVSAWTTFDSLEKLEECVYALMAKSEDTEDLEERLKVTRTFIVEYRSHFLEACSRMIELRETLVYSQRAIRMQFEMDDLEIPELVELSSMLRESNLSFEFWDTLHACDGVILDATFYIHKTEAAVRKKKLFLFDLTILISAQATGIAEFRRMEAEIESVLKRKTVETLRTVGETEWLEARGLILKESEVNLWALKPLLSDRKPGKACIVEADPP